MSESMGHNLAEEFAGVYGDNMSRDQAISIQAFLAGWAKRGEEDTKIAGIRLVFDRIVGLSPIAIQKWGSFAQRVKACEELGELITVICKDINGSPQPFENLTDELADGLIMIFQMILLFKNESETIERMHYKLDRLEKAINRP